MSIFFLAWLMIFSHLGYSFSQKIYYWTGLTLSTPLLYFAILPLFRSFHIQYAPYLTIDISLLLTLIATYSYSIYSTVKDLGHHYIYFDSILLVLCILYLSRYLEVSSIKRVTKLSQDLHSLTSKRVKVVTRDNQYEEVELKDIAIRDKLYIAPGEYIPVDGIICKGDTSVDESMLTGEALTLPKFTKDPVRAGTYNLDKVIIIEAISTFEGSYLGKTLTSLKGTQLYKYQNTLSIDQFSLWHQIIAFSLAFAIYCWWLPYDAQFALLCFVSSLLILCPCALGISYPLAISAILNVCAKKGIYLKNVPSFLKLGDVEHILFDKTGTLTEGNLIVTHVEFLNHAQQDEMLPLIAAIEKKTHHPIAHAITSYAEKFYDHFPTVDTNRLRVFPGKGLRTLVNDQFVLIGSAQWLKKNGIFIAADVIAEEESQNRTSDYIFVHCAMGGIEIARFHLKDQVRSNAQSLIADLKAKNLDLTILSGDHLAIVNAVARQIGPISVSAQALPQKKEAQVANLQNQGRIVAMVGDGLNDALALRQADIGIAMGSGNPITIFCADIILASSDIALVKDCIALSQKTQKILKQNYAFALLFNVILLPFAALGKLTPLVTLISLFAISFIIMINVVRLRLFN